MQSASVHIAVLAIARDAAPTKAVSELVTAAGHQVVARAMVMDAKAAIRSQLTKWIEDANIDVVIVAGGAESTDVTAAMKPLVTETLPGFTDLFRYLAFQEIGASAMLSNAEAARCNTTFVFVLPANEGAVRAALAKLILPQLDSNTTPQNLVTSMPRLREVVTDAVPAVIAQEKTAGGSGFAPRSPALATPPRGRPVTGANIVARRQTSDDPPTKPIDVAKLEQQIAISEAGSATTKQIDLSRLPRLPPGADDTLADVPILDERSRNGRAVRPESEPIAPPASSRSGPRSIQHTPQRGTAVAAATSHPLPSIRKPPTEPPPTPRKIQRTEPAAVVPPAKPAPARPRPASAAPTARPPTRPPTLPPSGPTARPPTQPPTLPSSGPTARPPTVPPIPRTRPPTEPPAPRTRPPTEPPAPRARPSSQPPPPPGERGPRVARAETRSVPIGTPTGAIPTVELPEELGAAEALPIRERSAPVDKPPVTDPALAVRLPSPPRRETPDLAALVAPSLSRTTGELPLGEFNYPIKKSGNKVVWLIALIAAGALGFAAVVVLGPRLTSSGSTARTPPVPEQPVAAGTFDASAAPTPSVEPIDEASTEPSVEAIDGKPPLTAETAPTPTPATTERPVRPARDPRPTATQKARDVTPTGSAAVAVNEPAEEPEEEPPVAPPISSSDCDEVACVLSKYDRPCCEKYRPKGSDLKPRGAGGIPTELDKVAVRAGVQKIKPRVVACGEKTSDKGTVKISVTVKPDGTVSRASVESSPTAALGDCVAAALRKAEFARTINGGSFTYPFVF